MCRDGELREGWTRYELSKGNGDAVSLAIASMPPEQQDDSRWRYWGARARFESGDIEPGRELLGELALEANYFGFMSADQLDLPYTICPQEPDVTAAEVDALKAQPGFGRALELREAGVPNWSQLGTAPCRERG